MRILNFSVTKFIFNPQKFKKNLKLLQKVKNSIKKS